jgi:hypothetical protein
MMLISLCSFCSEPSERGLPLHGDVELGILSEASCHRSPEFSRGWRCHVGWVPDGVDEDMEYDPIDAGLLGAVGVVLEPYCIAHLAEQLLGSLWHATVGQSDVAQRPGLRYNVDKAGAEAEIPRDGRMIHPDGSAKRPGGGFMQNSPVQVCVVWRQGTSSLQFMLMRERFVLPLLASVRLS